MRRVLHVPMMDLEVGDLITMPFTACYCEERVIESRPSEDGDMEWFIRTDGGYFDQFGEPHRQFVLVQER